MVLYIGAHINKIKDYYTTIKKIKTLDGNVVSIFVGSPKQLKIIDIPEKEVGKINEFLKVNKIILVTHAKYIHNFARPYEGRYKFFVKVYASELENTYRMGGIGSVIHFGKYTDMTIDESLQNMYENLTMTISKVFPIGTSSHKKKNLKIILETSSGQGSELLTQVPDIGKFYKRFSTHQRKHIRFCIDTCHIFSAGYDIRTAEGMKEYLKLWDKHIKIDRIVLIHLNDSAMPLGSKKDRHAPLKTGYITESKLGGSMDGIKFLVQIAKKLNIPMILERGDNPTKLEINYIKQLANS